jgi:hypothetical protein
MSVGCRTFGIEFAGGRSQDDALRVHDIRVGSDGGIASLYALVEHDETETRSARLSSAGDAAYSPARLLRFRRKNETVACASRTALGLYERELGTG